MDRVGGREIMELVIARMDRGMPQAPAYGMLWTGACHGQRHAMDRGMHKQGHAMVLIPGYARISCLTLGSREVTSGRRMGPHMDNPDVILALMLFTHGGV